MVNRRVSVEIGRSATREAALAQAPSVMVIVAAIETKALRQSVVIMVS
jgi:hypothetical protein